MKERTREIFGKMEKKLIERVAFEGLKKQLGKFKFTLILLVFGMCLSVMPGVVLAMDEEVAVSDTEQFLRWHTTAFGTAWYLGNSPQSIIEADDGSYVVAGYSAPGENKAFTQHGYITKFNKNGTIVWDRVYGGGADGTGTVTRYAHYKFLKVIQLANGDYLAIGETNDALGMPVNGYLSVFAVRLDNNGNTLWQKAYGLKDKETNINAWDGAENEDGSISIWGNYWSKYNGYDRGYPAMIELDISSGGNLLNEFLVTDDFGEDATTDAGSCSMKKTADGGYIAYQNICLSSIPWTDTIVKLNAEGQREWGFTLLPNDSSTGYTSSRITDSKIVVLSDGYLVAAITTVKNTEGIVTNTPIVYKIDLAGNVKWTKIYQNLTLTNRATNVFAYKTTTDDVLLSVENGYSTIDFTVFKLETIDGNVQWVNSYGNKNGFEGAHGGNANFIMLENSNSQIVGVGNTYITKFAGNGSLAFVTDDFMVQNRTNYAVSNVDTTILNSGVLEKRLYPENVVMEKDISLLTGLSSHDIKVVAEGGSLQSIAITTPATKLTYKVGDGLDLSGLVVTGTYSDGTTRVETISAANIIGFNSAAAAENQVLTIKVGDQTITYNVRIVASTDVGVQERRIFNSWNIGGVESGTATSPTFTITEPYAITFISDYHYLGSDQPAGTISLRHEDGTIYGPWTAQLLYGNIWVINNKAPGTHEDYRAELGTVVSDSKYPVIKAGTYTIIDSDPTTWSINGESGYYGFTNIKGYKTSEVNDDPTEGLFTAFLGQDPDDNYYLYDKTDLNNSFLGYQINPGLSSAKMYQHFLGNQCRIVALKDRTKGYMDYNAAATASLLAQMRGEAFDINSYFGRSDAKLYDSEVSSVGIVDKDGNVSY